MASVPLFFGDDSQLLYGVFHAGTRTDKAVLICPPIGYEHMRSHRALKTLAQRCAERGLASLRFDYFGTGHSAGQFEDAGVGQWQADVATACNELQQTTGADSIVIVGLRFACVLAALHAHENSTITQLIFWDAVNSGIEFIDEMRTAEANLQLEKDPLLNAQRVPKAHSYESLLGYPFSPALLKDIATLSLDERLLTQQLTFISGDSHQLRVSDAVLASAKQYTCQGPSNWCEIDNFGSVLLPQECIRMIARECDGLA